MNVISRAVRTLKVPRLSIKVEVLEAIACPAASRFETEFEGGSRNSEVPTLGQRGERPLLTILQRSLILSRLARVSSLKFYRSFLILLFALPHIVRGSS